MEEVPADFVDKWIAYFQHLDSINWIAVAIAVGTVILSLNFYRITRVIPGSFVAIVLSTALIYFFDLPVATIESSFGEISNKIPAPQIPGLILKLSKSSYNRPLPLRC